MESTGSSPLYGGDSSLALDGQVFLPAAATEQIVRVSAAALSSEPAVHVGAVAAVTLAVGAVPAAGVALLHVLVEVGHAGLAQLAHHHLVSIVGVAHVLREEETETLKTVAAFGRGKQALMQSGTMDAKQHPESVFYGFGVNVWAYGEGKGGCGGTAGRQLIGWSRKSHTPMLASPVPPGSTFPECRCRWPGPGRTWPPWFPRPGPSPSPRPG